MTVAGRRAPSRVLLVDDDVSLLRALTVSLRASGYEVVVARNGREGLDLAAHRHPDVVLLDLGLPDVDGVEVVTGLRGWSTVPIIVLSARHQGSSKVVALDAGADDYLTKPFGMDELLARLRAALRRAGGVDDRPRIEAGELVIDLAATRVTRGGKEVHLTPKEWRLVEVLARNAGRLVSRQQLLVEIWGPGYGSESEYLRVLIGRIRKSSSRTRRSPATSGRRRAWATASSSERPYHQRVHRPTVDVYDDRGLAWAATHSRAGRRREAEAFAAAAAGSARLDLGCGAGRYAPDLGAPLIALDASPVMLAACRRAVPAAGFVLADVEALPFARRSVGGAWSCMTHLHVPRVRLPMAFWDLHRVLDVGAPLDLQLLFGRGETDALAGDDVGGRFFAGWREEELEDVVGGAGFSVDPASVRVDGDELRLTARRAWTLADTVGAGMRLLVCGLNPSPAAADTGVGFAGPGNRFWPAALGAGLVGRDRDPLGRAPLPRRRHDRRGEADDGGRVGIGHGGVPARARAGRTPGGLATAGCGLLRGVGRLAGGRRPRRRGRGPATGPGRSARLCHALHQRVERPVLARRAHRAPPRRRRPRRRSRRASPSPPTRQSGRPLPGSNLPHMLIWMLMAVGLVVIAIITFTGRRRYRDNRSGSSASHTTHTTHHGKNAHNHRGRGSH